jgi:hypothetical protein
MQKTYLFYAHGMGCGSCVEKGLLDLSYVSAAKADARTGIVEVTGDFEGIPAAALARDFSMTFVEQKIRFAVMKKK